MLKRDSQLKSELESASTDTTAAINAMNAAIEESRSKDAEVEALEARLANLQSQTAGAFVNYQTEVRRLEEQAGKLGIRKDGLQQESSSAKSRLQSKEAELSSLLQNYEKNRERNEAVLEREQAERREMTALKSTTLAEVASRALARCATARFLYSGLETREEILLFLKRQCGLARTPQVASLRAQAEALELELKDTTAKVAEVHRRQQRRHQKHHHHHQPSSPPPPSAPPPSASSC